MSLSFTEWLWWQFQSDWIQHCSCTNCTVQTVSPLALLITHSRGSCVETNVFFTCSGWPPHYKCLTVTHTTTNQYQKQVNAVLYIILQYVLHTRERQSDGGSPLVLVKTQWFNPHFWVDHASVKLKNCVAVGARHALPSPSGSPTGMRFIWDKS